jgi:hypothetical protein
MKSVLAFLTGAGGGHCTEEGIKLLVELSMNMIGYCCYLITQFRHLSGNLSHFSFTPAEM